MSREIINSVLLLWGSLFCAVSSLYFWITKYYRTVKRDWIYGCRSRHRFCCSGMQ